jgi:hypothetical protein
MTIDRRSFLYAGSLTAAAAPFAMNAAHAAAGQDGRSVRDFGIVSDVDRDQTEAIQKAIDELSKAGLTVVFPGGFYRAGKLRLPSNCALVGTQGRTRLAIQELASNHAENEIAAYSLFGLIFPGGDAKSSSSQLLFEDAFVNIVACHFEATRATAITLKRCSGILDRLSIDAYSSAATGISSSDPAPAGTQGLTISACRFNNCGSAISAVDGRATITQNHFDRCGTAVIASGTGIINGNAITGAKTFGLKLGSAKGQGHIMAQGNLIRDCRIGVGVASSGDDIMVALNMIAGAKEGAIRAFDGDRLVGPDLAKQSAEAYLNLMVAGNVVR